MTQMKSAALHTMKIPACAVRITQRTLILSRCAVLATEAQNGSFYDDIYARKLDNCVEIHAKKNFLYFNSNGTASAQYNILIFGNYFTTGFSVMILSALGLMIVD